MWKRPSYRLLAHPEHAITWETCLASHQKHPVEGGEGSCQPNSIANICTLQHYAVARTQLSHWLQFNILVTRIEYRMELFVYVPRSETLSNQKYTAHSSCFSFSVSHRMTYSYSYILLFVCRWCLFLYKMCNCTTLALQTNDKNIDSLLGVRTFNRHALDDLTHCFRSEFLICNFIFMFSRSLWNCRQKWKRNHSYIDQAWRRGNVFFLY